MLLKSTNNFLDDPGHLRADVDGDDGGDVAGGVDDLAHGAAGDGLGPIRRGLFAAAGCRKEQPGDREPSQGILRWSER
jgi:hypothetical protein